MTSFYKAILCCTRTHKIIYSFDLLRHLHVCIWIALENKNSLDDSGVISNGFINYYNMFNFCPIKILVERKPEYKDRENSTQLYALCYNR